MPRYPVIEQLDFKCNNFNMRIKTNLKDLNLQVKVLKTVQFVSFLK